MAATASVPESTQPVRTPIGTFRARRWVLFAIAAFVAAAVIYVTVLILNWPFTEQSVIDVLQERSVRSVTIAHFRRTYWPPGCVAEGIHFLHRKHKDKPPLISIQKLVIKGSYTAMLTIDPRLSRVIVIGMHVTVPPSDPNGGPNPVMPLTHSNTPGPAMVIDRLVADGTVLDFMSREPGKKPFHLAIDKLVIDGVGNNAPLAYRTIISNSLPPGKIRSAGVFGPWNPDNPASTPVKGSYTYENANLAAFSALSGTLSSSGKFSGTLGRIAVEGTAEVPNFHLTNTSHTRKLSAEFHATVDGTNGDTMLESVAGHFDRTTVFCQGGVIGQKGENGKTISLDMVSRNGRIEDLLKLFISARQAPMTGSVSLRAHVEVPPGEQPFVQRMNLTGDFGVDAGKFTNKETQAAIDRLSAGDQGKKTEENAQNALSDLRGHAAATNGVAKLSNLSFRVPDATARLHGTYGLREPYNINLHGTLATTHPSDATTGFKSFLLRAMTPFLSKKGHDRIVPFKIIGNYHAAQTGLDLGSKQ